MVRVLVDTGPLVALLNARDRAHLRVDKFMAGFRGEMLTTWAVLAETCHLLPRHLVVQFMHWAAAGGVQLREVPPFAMADIAAAMEKYADRPMDLADASLIWLASSSGITEVLTLDKADFGAYRLPDGRRLRNLLAGQ